MTLIQKENTLYNEICYFLLSDTSSLTGDDDRGGAHLFQHPPAGPAWDNQAIKVSADDVPPQNQLSGAEGDDH